MRLSWGKRRRFPPAETPALILDGAASYPFMHTTARALANAMPHAQHRSLAGQAHEVVAEVLAPVLVEFFDGSPAIRTPQA